MATESRPPSRHPPVSRVSSAGVFGMRPALDKLGTMFVFLKTTRNRDDTDQTQPASAHARFSLVLV